MTLYSPDLEHTSLESELRRLEAQARLGWAAEARRLSALGAPATPSILELGCGPGFVTRALQDVFPGCKVTGVDTNAALLDRARVLAPSATFLCADAAATPLADAAFDLVLSRYLFQHLRAPDPVALEALRVLKPGGIHAIVDIDDGLWGLAQPAFPRMRAIHAEASRLQERDGRDRLVGRQLWSILSRAGYIDIDVDVFCYGSDWLGLEPFLPQLDPARLMPFVTQGRLPMSDYIAAEALYARFTAAADAKVLLLSFIGSGRRPS